ncbi:molybdenum cofactor sulfurase [Podospora aff. communis PSN243]|uniref:Molybdenum cofactor sulfurase n=1 Tax=Podospora aff. communis PSN243 TaxID=3040156 RepID=A0AAV9GPU1_9PEZI|nr:molybdenum cofactor sulfurase [Podospora aff. communis PSN243]
MDQPELTAALRSGPGVDAGGILLVAATILVFILPALIYFPPMLPSKTEALLQTHTPIGLHPSRSGLRDGRAKRALAGQHSAGPAKLRSLWVYPIKSCKGIEVSRSKVLPTGLEFDRLYTFAQLKSPFPVGVHSSDAEKSQHKWEFITQRQFPLLATVEVDLFVPDVAKARDQEDATSESFIVFRFPWVEKGLFGEFQWLLAKLGRGWRALPEMEVLLPVSFPTEDEVDARGYTFEEMSIWRDPVMALNMETELPRELRLYLGVSNRLGIFRIDPARLRPVYRCAPKESDAGYQPCIGFQDAYPLHLLNLASVRDLETIVAKDEQLQHLDPRRFRANIIIDAPAYAEETWKDIRFHHVDPSIDGDSPRFHVSCRTVRCKLPNVDQDTGLRHPVEPDRSLRKFRNVDPGAKNNGCLGMQLTPLFEKTAEPEGMETWLEVGMGVEVLGTGEHVYIAQ